jgi:hemerythrin superfamily protein
MNIKETVSRVFGKAPPDALALMKADHREVEALFEKALADKTPAAQRRTAVAKITQALTIHAEMEEAIFYPALRRAGGAEERDSVLEAAEEHAVVKGVIAKIEASRGRDETLNAKVTVLKELVQHHVKEEESTIFDEAKRALGSEKLAKLGAEMQRFKSTYGKAKKSPVAARKAARGTPSASKKKTAPAKKKKRAA